MSSEIENEVLNGLKHAARPLVELGLYDSARDFIRDITKEFINHKIEFYKKQIAAFKKKYGSFETFSKKLEKGASIAEEDEWMDWEAAEDMLKV
ncbi:Uncharacterised protein [uncultured archaeon]|nr:Uncharacterised protein [uncultured archaeon]